MKVIVHIGGEKTGTTSVQVALWRSRAQLARDGVLYPASLAALGEGNHVKLYAYASEGPLDELKGQLALRSKADVEAFRHRVAGELAAEIEAGDFHTLVLSNEHCSSRLRLAAEVERLAALLSPHAGEVRIVLYIRPQWDLLVSSFSTNVKAGVPAPLGLPSAKELSGKYDFRRIIELWRGVFGAENVVVRRYAPAALEDGDIVADFAALCDLDEAVRPVAPQNTSLRGRALEFLRRFNAVVPRTIDFRPNPSRGNIVQILETYEAPGDFVPDPAVLKAMAAWSEPINRWVSEAAFGGEPVFAAPPFDTDASSAADTGELDLETAFALFGFLWETKQKQVNGLLNKLNAKKGAPG